MKRWLPVFLCLVHLVILVFLARQHPFGTYATETDFYHYYAPDAERLANGEFPQNTFQGPGYPAMLALLGKLTGLSGDLFTLGKWLSVVCAVLCGGLVFVLFARLFGFWTGLGAQMIAMASGEFPQFSLNAATDVFFLALCLATLVVFTNRWKSARWQVIVAGLLTGLAYVTRYNGLFLVVACLVGIILFRMFDGKWRAVAFFLAAFFVTASPWFYANAKHHGSPLYNTNYLNMATVFYPELVAGKTNQDATRALETQFHSFGDVLRYDPKRLVVQYPINLWESLQHATFDGLLNRWVVVFALAGLVMALWRKRSSGLLFALVAGLLYLCLMALNHWETRYYFFVMTLCAGLAAYAMSGVFDWVKEQGWFQSQIFEALPVIASLLLFATSVNDSRRDVTNFLANHPMEIANARAFLDGVTGKRIVARKPHLAYLTRNEWVFFPPVKSLDELRTWVENNRVDYLAIGKRELKERKELASLGDPKKAPDWLKAVWKNDDPVFILYQPQFTSAP